MSLELVTLRLGSSESINWCAKYLQNGFQATRMRALMHCQGEEHLAGYANAVRDDIAISGSSPGVLLMLSCLGVKFCNNCISLPQKLLEQKLSDSWVEVFFFSTSNQFKPCLGSGSYIKRSIWSFGQYLGKPDLAEVVENLYDAALKNTSKNTYNTGRRAYQRFAADINKKEALQPFQQRSLGKTELYLSFYIA